MLFYYWLNISQCGPYVLFFAPFSFSMRYIISPNLMCHICLRQFMSSVCPCSLCSCCAIYVSIPYAPLSYPFKLMNTCHMPYLLCPAPFVIPHVTYDPWPMGCALFPVLYTHVPCDLCPCALKLCTIFLYVLCPCILCPYDIYLCALLTCLQSKYVP